MTDEGNHRMVLVTDKKNKHTGRGHGVIFNKNAAKAMKCAVTQKTESPLHYFFGFFVLENRNIHWLILNSNKKVENVRIHILNVKIAFLSEQAVVIENLRVSLIFSKGFCVL